MKRILARVVWVALLALGLTQGGDAAPAMPPAGTKILNQASGTYVEGDTARPPQPSNRVEVEVQPFLGLSLVRDQSLRLPAGSRVSLAHVLTNLGNVRTAFVVEARNLEGDEYDLAGLELARGPALQDLRSRLSVVLEPGASMNLLLAGTVPAGAPDGALARVEVVASTEDGSLRALNLDQIRVDGGVVRPTVTWYSNPTFGIPWIPRS